jgi:hypothetical protein
MPIPRVPNPGPSIAAKPVLVLLSIPQRPGKTLAAVTARGLAHSDSKFMKTEG